MIAESTPVWREVGEASIWFAAVIAAIGALSRTKVIRWLYRQLITRPMTEWGRKVVSEVVEEKVSNTNGGSSLRDKVNDIESSLNNIHNCLDRRFSTTHEAIDKLTAYSEQMIAESLGVRERVRQLYRALDLPVFEANTHGGLTYVNPAFTKMTGLAVEDALGEGWAESIHPDDRSRVFKTWNQAIDNASIFTAVWRFQHVSSKEIVEVRGSASPLHDAHENVVGWVGTLDQLD